MVNDKGPEDSPGWHKVFEKAPHPVVEACHKCRNTITLWHCADSGCPWCAKCGANAKDVREKRKNGTD